MIILPFSVHTLNDLSTDTSEIPAPSCTVTLIVAEEPDPSQANAVIKDMPSQEYDVIAPSSETLTIDGEVLPHLSFLILVFYGEKIGVSTILSFISMMILGASKEIDSVMMKGDSDIWENRFQNSSFL